MSTCYSFVPLLALAWIAAFPLGSHGAMLVVANTAGSGPGSLREAIDMANANTDADVITFDAALAGQNIAVSDLVISNEITIDASDLAGGMGIINLLTFSSGAIHRILEVSPNSIVELNNLRIVGGYSGQFHTDHGGGILAHGPGTLTLNECTLSLNSSEGNGGAIAVTGSGLALTLNRCTITRNMAQSGGGIHSGSSQNITINECIISENGATLEGGGVLGSMTINNSTIHGNSARIRGGGIRASSPFRLNNSTLFGNSAPDGGGIMLVTGSSGVINNSTISANHALVKGGGIFVLGGIVLLTNSIVAGNTAPSNSNVNFAIPAPNNLIDGDPHLAPPGNYGGPTPTMPPLSGSPALDAGEDSVTNSLATDQRGYPRLAGAHVDIGAAERQIVSATEAPVLKLSFTSSPDTDFTVLATTNVALPAHQWSTLGPPKQNAPGQYEFSDIFAPDYSRRFYNVTSP